jgi:hypothetical protein
MTSSVDDALPWLSASGKNEKRTAETTGGGREPVPWVVVAHHLNPGEATIIKGRLDSEEIPAIVQQEAMGAVLGLTVGPLGSAKILVPEPLAERTLNILAETFEVDPLDLEEADPGLGADEID